MSSARNAGPCRAWLQALVLASVLVLALPTVAHADIALRSAEEIQTRWQQLRPVYSGNAFTRSPRLVSPYSAGALKQGFLQDGLNSVNYARYLAGLPDDVVLDPTYTDRAQHGAVLLSVGQFAHSQPKPANMSQSFYDIANQATGSSNIGSGYSNLWQFTFSCLDDSGPGNIDRVGHRRWLLFPPLKKTGMGFADGMTDAYVFDWSRTRDVSYDAIKWPAAGAFPVEVFGTSVPWSVTLNPDRYTWTTGTRGHKVVMRRRRDGKTWTFTSADTDKSGEYFNFETQGFGVNNCIIFRPDPDSVGSYEPGDVFEVTISGGITRKSDRSPAVISYTTEFVSHLGGTAPDTTPTVHPTPTPAPVPTSTRVRAVPSLSKPVAPSTMSRTTAYRVYATLRPRHTAGSHPVRIYRYRYVSRRWRSYGYVMARAADYSTYTRCTAQMRLGAKGRWRLRAYAPADHAHTARWSSRYDYVSVR